MNNKSIPISVLMPVYNGEKYINEAINSVLNQTFTQFELIIVNDGSTDRTEEIIKSYNDPRIVLINQSNAGVSAALNNGLKKATGTYIARFDADDVCYPERIEQQYGFMLKNPDYILTGSDVDYISENGEFIFSFSNMGHSNEEINEVYMQQCPFVHSSVMYLKEVVNDLGAYDIHAHTFEDYFLWVKLIKRGKVLNFKTPFIKVRFNPASVTIDEKDYEPVFIQLKRKALLTCTISPEEGRVIKESIGRLNKTKKEGSYNRMLGKKYLWNNYQPAKARVHLLRAIQLEPLKFKSYILLALSLLPKSIIETIYNINKAK